MGEGNGIRVFFEGLLPFIVGIIVLCFVSCIEIDLFRWMAIFLGGGWFLIGLCCIILSFGSQKSRCNAGFHSYDNNSYYCEYCNKFDEDRYNQPLDMF